MAQNLKIMNFCATSLVFLLAPAAVSAMLTLTLVRVSKVGILFKQDAIERKERSWQEKIMDKNDHTYENEKNTTIEVRSRPDEATMKDT
jgi:hypothetical protein